MTSPTDFERRVASDLRHALDAVAGPHPRWSGSPASSRIAAPRDARLNPGRLLMIAAVLAIGGGAALWVGLRSDTPAGCPTLADYAAASSQPWPPAGTAPDVSFPPVGPDASPTTGLLELGTWAVLPGDGGPGGVMRVRDIVACDRLPNIRSVAHRGGSFLIARMDLQLLDGERLRAWMGPRSVVEGQVDGRSYGGSIPPGPSIPGMDYRTFLDPKPGFSISTRIVFEVPGPPGLVIAAYPGVVGTPSTGRSWRSSTTRVWWGGDCETVPTGSTRGIPGRHRVRPPRAAPCDPARQPHSRQRMGCRRCSSTGWHPCQPIPA